MEDRPITTSSGLVDSQASPDVNPSVLQIWGGYPLHGHVKVSGAKNSALAIIAAALLCPEDCRIRNVPLLVDVARMGQILLALGVKLEQHGDVLDINASDIGQSKAPYELVSQLRASFFL